MARVTDLDRAIARLEAEIGQRAVELDARRDVLVSLKQQKAKPNPRKVSKPRAVEERAG